MNEHREPGQDFTEPLSPIEITREVLGRTFEIGWEMLWVKGFPMPKGRRNVLTGDAQTPPVEKVF